jgi:hypothetical protein
MALGGSPADFAKLISDEVKKWGKVVLAANMKRDEQQGELPNYGILPAYVRLGSNRVVLAVHR